MSVLELIITFLVGTIVGVVIERVWGWRIALWRSRAWEKIKRWISSVSGG